MNVNLITKFYFILIIFSMSVQNQLDDQKKSLKENLIESFEFF